MSEKRSLEDIFLSTFHNKYSFKEFIELDISKEYEIFNINDRTIYSPSAKLKAFHRFIISCILEYAEFNKDVVFSYRKGTTIRDAVERHSNNSFFFQTDIKSFFTSISTNDVKSTLLHQLVDIPVSDVNHFIDLLIKYCVVDNILPTGFSTSPILSNLCLFKFDNQLEKLAKEKHLHYSRYSDDLILSSKSLDTLNEIELTIQRYLTQYINSTIKLNQSKTKITKKGQRIKLLGLVILPNGIVTIDKKTKRQMETLFHLYLTDDEKFENYISTHFKNKKDQQTSLKEYGISILSGKLMAINSMDKGYLNKLRTKYGNTVIEMFLRKTVK
ncbi:RNA-directed DNA polymerase [Colwellia sp. Arc7-635]|jgi:RNA-directed DNA polymerase|uniref:reverse transcriptase domain-containing protein n=1 Tax=Colwellia sp. Arc7-635 TaxID=2497879 RepID=UPI000F8560B6|nr:reverse transcriptase domain-containing protein [Colwellia sp. Arc7-635]AZQ85328.1 RNA-directed DNA polymerase [Colwellia sp. Arc7-635]